MVLTKRNVLPRIRALRRLAQTRLGRDTDTMELLYTSLLRPSVEYQHPLLLISYKSVVDKVEIYQNSCLRIISGASAQARNADLRKIPDTPSIRGRCVFLSSSMFGICARKTSVNPEREHLRTQSSIVLVVLGRETWNASVIELSYPDGLQIDTLFNFSTLYRTPTPRRSRKSSRHSPLDYYKNLGNAITHFLRMGLSASHRYLGVGD